MPNPLEKAVKSGIRMNDRIGDLFARIGTSAHPRGEVLTDYDIARLSLESALAKEIPLPAVREVLRNLRRQLNADVTGVLNEAVALGEDEASRQLRFYNTRPRGSIRLTEQSNSALEATMSQFDAQAAAITALVLSQADPAQIIGDEDRTGILSSGIVTTAAAYWATHLVWNAFDTQVTSQEEVFQKQAVAALDARTTDCCLRVHGQVVELDEPFHLTGTPRFADDMDWPAFHWYCRTSGVLYQPEFDDGLTDKMQEGSTFFLDERAAGKSPDNNPVDAFK